MSSVILLAHPTRPRWRTSLAVLVVLATATGGFVDATTPAGAAPPEHANHGGGGSTDDGGTTCHPRRGCEEPADDTAPTVAIASPSAGDTLSGVVDVTGSSRDDVAVDVVAVAVDGGPFVTASGTTAWSYPLDLTEWAAGDHVITARATDTSGNSRVASVDVRFAPEADTVAPTVTITTPADGGSVSGSVEVAGTAGDDIDVAEVRVSVDDRAPVLADGTESWSRSLDASSWTVGEHTIVATAADTSGNSRTTSATVVVETESAVPEEFSSGDLTWTRQRLEDPQFPGEDLTALQYGRLPSFGDVTGVLYRDRWTGHRGVHLRDASSGASSYVALPGETSGWASARATLSSPTDLWVLGGLGVLTLRHFRLSVDPGDELAASAALVHEIELPSSDSRVGDVVALASGAVVPVWRELSAPEYRIGYVTADGALVDVETSAFMPVGSSNQVVVQHPADEAVWLFSNADSWSNIGAIRLREGGGGLVLEMADGFFIDSDDGAFDADPEHPKLAAAPDPARGTVTLAYQSADRWRHSTTPWVVSSVVALARIAADGQTTFEATPVRAERISWLGLTVTEGHHLLAYRPVDPETLDHEEVHVVQRSHGTWGSPVSLGRTSGVQDPVLYDPDGRDLALQLASGGLHRFRFA